MIVDFQHDLAEIAKDMMRQAGISIAVEWNDCYCCIKYFELLHRWFDSSIPYKVVYSKELWKKLSELTANELSAVQNIVYRLENCISITLYMSKDIKKTAIQKSDFLLKNWDIYHLHLEKQIPKKRFTNPNLLFFQTKGQVVHLIDIRKHPKGSEWFIKDLLEIVYENWPWLLNYFPGCTPTHKIEDCHVHNTLKSMVVGIPFKNGMLMPTTLGVAGSGDSGTAVRTAYNILNRLRLCETELRQNEKIIRNEIFTSMFLRVDEPLDYTLIIEDGFFVAYEKHTNAKIRLFEAK